MGAIMLESFQKADVQMESVDRDVFIASQKQERKKEKWRWIMSSQSCISSRQSKKKKQGLNPEVKHRLCYDKGRDRTLNNKPHRGGTTPSGY